MRLVSQAVLLFAMLGICAAAWIVVILKPYTPGSDLGYNLGLAGGLMMLWIVVSYPARKRFKFMQRAGPMKPWFQLHMALGILGPVLIAFHSTFTISSVNAFVAFMSMAIVSSSGFIGRYAYRQVHHGLYGRKATLQEFEDHMRTSERGLAALVRALPQVDLALQDYKTAAFDPKGNVFLRAWRFAGARLRSERLARSIDGDIAGFIHRIGPAQGWDKATQARRVRRGGGLVRAYLRAVNTAAQFSTFERVFSMWHVMHVPLLYMLIFSACYHVLAVHMY
jgi:hypothetical protein